MFYHVWFFLFLDAPFGEGKASFAASLDLCGLLCGFGMNGTRAGQLAGINDGFPL